MSFVVFRGVTLPLSGNTFHRINDILESLPLQSEPTSTPRLSLTPSLSAPTRDGHSVQSLRPPRTLSPVFLKIKGVLRNPLTPNLCDQREEKGKTMGNLCERER